MKKYFIVSILFLTFSLNGFAQLSTYNYEIPLREVKPDAWQTLILPDSVYGKLNRNANDFRIYGKTKTDTIEVPYLTEKKFLQVKNVPIAFQIINRSQTKNKFYATLKLNTPQLIDQIDLQINQPNFDWKITLQGSNNQTEWFTILEDYRISAMQTPDGNFSYTTLRFLPSEYQYYRIIFPSEEKVALLTAQFEDNEVMAKHLKKYDVKLRSVTQNKLAKTTEITVDLPLPLPIAKIAIAPQTSGDYFRNVLIQTVQDSVKNKNGWRKLYKTIKNGVLNSQSDNVFYGDNDIAQQLKITIYNNDNEPLKVKEILIFGSAYRLIARFPDKQADYVLAFGKSDFTPPTYDLGKFTENIPEKITNIAFGTIQQIAKPDTNSAINHTFFNSKITVWVLMAIVVALLLFFVLKMIRET